MKKLVAILFSTILLLLLVPTPVMASLDIQGIYYNFDAVENEDALYVNFYGRPNMFVRANEFQPQKVKGQWETLTDIEQRIQEKFWDLLITDTKLSTVEPDDPWHQEIFAPGEELVIINNSEWVRQWKAYFKIHIYSLDDLETPESELNFVTRFQNRFAGQIPDNWWPEG